MNRTGCLKVLRFLLVSNFLLYAEVSAATVDCTSNVFLCSNGICVKHGWLCDDYDDCKDNSDERFCARGPCHPLTFQCLNGKCISRTYVCYSGNNCGDNSDEKYCDSGSCHPSAFQCLNGECMSRARFCNNDNDCRDNSDERYCNKTRDLACPRGWFECPNKQRCIPSSWVCDGSTECTGESEERTCAPGSCHPSAFQCLDGKCISRGHFCFGGYECGDNSDESYCNKPLHMACPAGWFECPNKQRCIPSNWVCDGTTECSGISEEENCGKKSEMKAWFLRRRKLGSRINRWGPQVHRIAIALHLADISTFSPDNSTGEEIRNELTIQLLHRLEKEKRMSSQELALYIHALLVACMDPRDFYGDDLVGELRRRVEEAVNYTNPFLILVLCNAGDTVTARDVERVSAAYDSQHRPFWTDYQALASMALACISSRSDVSVDERNLRDMLQELKRRQFRNGTVDNFRTTALVTQALFIHDSYKKDFDLDLAIKVLTDGLNKSSSLLNQYYAIPVLNRKSLLNISSSHCSKEPIAEEEALQKALDVNGETITVQYSVWIGDEVNVGQTWRLRIRVNSTIYDAIETVAKIDNRQKVEYNVVEGKPFVSALYGKEEDPEMGTFWFICRKTINGDENPKILEESPVDIKLRPNQEIILWYKRGPWSGQSQIQNTITSS